MSKTLPVLSSIKPQPNEIFMEEEFDFEERTVRYIKLYRELVLDACFENYWTLAFEERLQEGMKILNRNNRKQRKRHIIKYPFKDIFKPFIVPSNNNNSKKKEQLTTVSVVPLTRYHWDAILFMYHLLFPEFFKSTGHVASYILRYIDNSDIEEIEEIQNFSKDTYEFLVKHSKAEHINSGRENWFVVDPGHAVYMMMRGHTLLINDLSGIETDEELAKITELVDPKDVSLGTKGEKIIKELEVIRLNVEAKIKEIFC